MRYYFLFLFIFIYFQGSNKLQARSNKEISRLRSRWVLLQFGFSFF
ncbi:hypothetical protein HMPREF3224_00958 [Anaerococcus hydrogenalis]|nr:hypothetical protein HMPREF3224_00958 [Anaerococcus hydrogenalis]